MTGYRQHRARLSLLDHLQRTLKIIWTLFWIMAALTTIVLIGGLFWFEIRWIIG